MLIELVKNSFKQQVKKGFEKIIKFDLNINSFEL